MPHDSKGTPIAAGDRVTVEFEVKTVSQGENDCNVSLAALNPEGQAESYLPAVTCNSKLVTKVALFLACIFLSAIVCGPASAAECAGGSFRPGAALARSIGRTASVIRNRQFRPVRNAVAGGWGFRSRRSDGG